MGKGRKKIGIVFGWDESWAGGLYYLLNVIHALNTLPDKEKPVLYIYDSNDNNVKHILSVKYPYLNFCSSIKKLSIFERIINKICKKIFGLYFFTAENIRFVDFIFPLYTYQKQLIYDFYKPKRIFWIADFQHKHLTHYFSKEEIEFRDKTFKSIADEKVKLVLSSNDAKSDFVKFYPNYKCIIHVLPFAVTHERIEHITKEELVKKYSIEEKYFIAPNQFWVHKNHITILKALKILREKGIQVQVIFTGREDDYRNSQHISSLKDYIVENDLSEYVKLLGFIDRKDQLKLIKESIAVIQPSQFEGWSTVVEDSKALGKQLILSNLKVHLEQCSQSALYFDPNDEEGLSKHIEFMIKNNLSNSFYDYENHIKVFAERLMKLFKN